jgi:predicted cupin superfamily sugar epimerase
MYIHNISVTCTALTSVSGANITFSTNGTQTQASYSCLPGYSLVGEVTSECDTSGTWTQTASTCGKFYNLVGFTIFPPFKLKFTLLKKDNYFHYNKNNETYSYCFNSKVK